LRSSGNKIESTKIYFLTKDGTEQAHKKKQTFFSWFLDLLIYLPQSEDTPISKNANISTNQVQVTNP
jgi:hypothetical protein